MPGFEIIGQEEQAEVNAVMQTGVLARYGFDKLRGDQWKARELEQELCRQFGCSYAQLVSSGTAALITALSALNIGAGHEVIIPVFGHVSCFEAVVAVGAVPVFADIDETLTMDPRAAEQVVTPRTKALIMAHTAGHPGDAAALRGLCDRLGLFLVEDASQAIGARLDGKPAGSFGHAGIVSFDFYNTITCGEGGALLTDDANLYKLCNEFSDHGHDHLAEKRSEDRHRYLGTNYRISELHAAVGLAQLRKLPSILAKQQHDHALLTDVLKDIPGVRFRRELPSSDGNCSHLSLLLPSEDMARRAAAALDQAGILYTYWYDDRWHYLRKWEHFRNGSWMNRLYNDQKRHILQHSNLVFPVSDALLSNCLSFAISLTRSEQELRESGKQIAAAIRAVTGSFQS